MKNILILGWGQMGRIVAQNFDNIRCQITVVDNTYYKDFKENRIQILGRDFKDVDYPEYDLVINCLPSRYGFEASNLVVSYGVDCVDLSFSTQDPFRLDYLAKETGSCYIPDAGLAPGLTNLFVGREMYKHPKLESAEMLVGGISQSPFAPYGYKATWSVEDLYEEHVRPARLICAGRVITKDPLNSLAPYVINAVNLEGFTADGCRTLLRHTDKILYLEEKTLRWPGHVEKIKPLIKNGTFMHTIKRECAYVDSDTVVFQVRTRGIGELCHKYCTMITHSDTSVSAMAKTTAYTCSVVANMVLDKVFNESGTHPLEDIGQNPIAFRYILDCLKGTGIHFKES